MGTMRRHLVVLLVMAGAVLAQPFLTPRSAQAEQQPTVTMTRLRIELSTTSDWATLHVEGASFPATRILRSDPLAPATFSGDGWTVTNSTGGGTTFVVDTIATELSGLADFRIVVQQGRYGSTTAMLHDDRRGTDPILEASAGEAGGGQASVTRAVTRSELLGPEQLQLPHGDSRRLVLAAYYPWFSRSGDPAQKMAEEPAQPRSAWDLDDVRSHAAQARAAGIDGFAVSWGGAEEDGPQMDLVLKAMEEQGGVVVPYLETARARGLLGWMDVKRVALWLDEALSRAQSPAFLRADDGIPVVMVFSMELINEPTWQAIAADSARRGRPVHLVGDADPSTHGAVLDGWHRYGATDSITKLGGLWQTMAQRLRGPNLLDPNAPIDLTVATVSPGYDDTNLRGDENPVVYRGAEGERYEQTWDAALAGDPDWVLITSWNEWFEGTSIEPGTISGDLALRQTATRIAAWKGLPPPVLTEPTTTTTTGAGDAPDPGEPRLPLLPLCLPGRAC